MLADAMSLMATRGTRYLLSAAICISYCGSYFAGSRWCSALFSHANAMSGGGNTVWERLTSNRRGSEATAGSGPKPNDREGVHLYAEFTECLDSYKGHAFAGIAAVTVPLSWYRKSINPIVVGFILGFVPDLIYANWRCDAKYKEFKRHLDAAVQQQQQQQQQQDAKQQ